MVRQRSQKSPTTKTSPALSSSPQQTFQASEPPSTAAPKNPDFQGLSREFSKPTPTKQTTDPLQKMANNNSAPQQSIQKKKNRTGLPDNLKTGMENLSGLSLDDVKVHRNSDKPAQLQANAYAQGTDIHLGPGQEKHLPHEAWHIVQQKQGRVKPIFQMQGAAINDDSSLEQEADVMGAKALRSSLQTTQLKKHDSFVSVLQRQITSFPEDSEEKLKQMGVLQKKKQSSPIQFRGGPTVGVLKIRSSHVGSSLLAGHAWLSYISGGHETTHGTWGNVDPIGYHRNLERGRSAGAERTTNVDNTDLGNLNNFIAANDSWGYLNNCASFAARGWKAITNESLAYKSFGIPNPSALGVGIVVANGGKTGVLPEDRGSSSNSVSSTSSSSIGSLGNTINSLFGSGSGGGSVNKSSGNTSM